MCQSNTELQFCTCINKEKKIVHNKNSRRYKKQLDKNTHLEQHLVWKLYRHLGKSHSIKIGMMMMPSNQLTTTIDNDFVLKKINAKNCFDFDYMPSEGDNLTIEIEYKQKKQVQKSNPNAYKYLSFIFKEGLWKAGFYDVFSQKKEQFQSRQLSGGKLHLIRQVTNSNLGTKKG